MSDFKQKTILHVNNFAGQGIGGGEQHLSLIAHAAREAGHKVSIACMPGSDLSKWLRSQDFRVIDFDSAGVNLLQAVIKLRRIIALEKAHIVHAHGFLPANISRFAVRFQNRQRPRPAVIATVHCQPNSVGSTKGGMSGRMNQLLRNTVDRLTARWGDKFIAVSKDIEAQLLRQGIQAERVVLIHNGIDLSEVKKQAQRPHSVNFDGRAIGVVARLEAVKGLSYLIKSFATISKDFPDVDLVIIGDGSLRRQLVQEVEELGLDDRVSFFGYLKNPLPVLAKLSVYVLPSLSEGLNVTLLEAMALSRPVVATDVGGNSELVKDKQTGLLIPPRDPEALAKAVMQLLSSAELSMELGQSGARLVEKDFSAANMCARVLSLYDGC